MSSKKGLVLRVYRTEEELAVLKTLSLCYNFQNIDDYLHFVIARGVEKDIEDFNKWSRENNLNTAAGVAAGLIAGDKAAEEFYANVEDEQFKSMIDEAKAGMANGQETGQTE